MVSYIVRKREVALTSQEIIIKVFEYLSILYLIPHWKVFLGNVLIDIILGWIAMGVKIWIRSRVSRPASRFKRLLRSWSILQRHQHLWLFADRALHLRRELQHLHRHHRWPLQQPRRLALRWTSTVKDRQHLRLHREHCLQPHVDRLHYDSQDPENTHFPESQQSPARKSWFMSFMKKVNGNGNFTFLSRRILPLSARPSRSSLSWETYPTRRIQSFIYCEICENYTENCYWVVSRT